MRLVRRLGVVTLAAAAVALSYAGGAAAADTAAIPWDPSKVSLLAQQLPPAADAWEQATRRLQDNIGSGTSQEVDDIVRKARTIHEMCNGLAAHIAKGDGKKQTDDMFQGIKEIQDDTNVLAPRANLDDPSQAAWSKLNGLLNQIRAYYGPPPQ